MRSCRGLSGSLFRRTAWFSRSCFSSATKPHAAKAAAAVPLRTNIGIFGLCNAGKSVLMNGMTQSQTSIVDETPGTTADVNKALIELHGLGPVKVFDTPGYDDTGRLGDKKVKKTMSVMKIVDLAVIVLDSLANRELQELAADRGAWFLHQLFARGGGRTAMLVHNIRSESLRRRAERGEKTEDAVRAMSSLFWSKQPWEEGQMDHVPEIVADLSKEGEAKRVMEAVVAHYQAHGRGRAVDTELIPGLRNYSAVLLNIPMDAETPTTRLLRPQAHVQENCLRNYVPTIAFRMNLDAARSRDLSVREREEARFRSITGSSLMSRGLVVSDSQAIEVAHKWTLDPESGRPTTGLTTFSVVLMNYMTGGRLLEHIEGLKAFKAMAEDAAAGTGKKKLRILVSEACNHMRIPETCNDIGMVQIPKLVRAALGGEAGELAVIDHSFGREFPDGQDLDQYDVIIHCGGCMIDRQSMVARMEDCALSGVPVTNYGLLLSLLTAPEALRRIISPWDLGQGW
jgi:hypothetical protein